MTVEFTPVIYASAHTYLMYVVSDAKASDAVTYPNYKYVADVYINGIFVSRLKRVPNPTDFRGVFNVGPIVRNFLNATFVPASTMFSMEYGSNLFNVSVQLKFGEEYGFTTTYNIVTDTARIAFNYYQRLQAGTTAPLGAFIDKVATNGNKAVNELSTFKATLATDYFFVSYFATSTSAIPITITGASTYSTTITPSQSNVMCIINVSPIIVNILQANTITSALDYYTVNINGDIFRVYLFCEAINTVYPIHFLNQWGGFETKLFSKVSRRNVAIEKKSYSTLPYRINDSTGAVEFRNGALTYYEDTYTYSSLFSETLTFNSDVLSDKEYNWLYDLIVSPLVYIQMNGFFYPVKITNTSYDVRKNINESDLSNLTISVDLGKQFNTQFR